MSMVHKKSMSAAIRNVAARVNSPMNISNSIVSLFYLCVVAKAVLYAAQYDASWVGATSIILVAMLLAWGHFFLKIWALKATAAMAWITLFFYFFYLTPGYDITPASTFPARLTYFCIATLLAALLSLNYWTILKKDRG